MNQLSRPATAAHSASGAPTRWAAVLVLALGTFATGTDLFVIAGILPSVASDLHVSVAVAGQLVTAYAIGYAFGGPVLIAIVPHWSPRRLLAVSMVGFAAANLFAATTDGIGALIVARVLAACFAALYVPTAAATASELVTPHRRGRALAVVIGGASVATVVGAPIGIWIQTQSSWRGTFVFIAAVALLALVGSIPVLPALPARARLSLRQRLAPLRQPSVVATLAVTAVAMTGGFAVYTYLGPLFVGQPGIGPSGLALLIGVFGLGSLVGSWLGGVLSDRWGARRVLLVALGVFTVNFGLLPLGGRTVPLAALFMAVWGLAGWAVTPAQQHELIHRAPRAAPLVLSLNASATYLGIALGAVVGGVVVGMAGAGSLWLAAMGLSVLSLAIAVIGPARPARSTP